MRKILKITSLMDNLGSEHKALINEHGLSYFIDLDGKRYLFDCGSSDSVLYNAHKLGISLENLDGVVLSHSHYDHAGGYRDLIEAGLGSKFLYTGSHFFEKKYAKNENSYTDLSCGFDRDFIRDFSVDHIEVDGFYQISNRAFLLSSFPRVYSYEKINPRFYKLLESGEEQMVLDDFEDELCLVLDTEKGLIVLVGCSHPGICNMIEKVHACFKKPIYALYGGTHLVEADKKRIDQTIDKFKEYGIKLVGLGHCSGEEAEKELEKDIDLKACHLSVGSFVIL